MKSPAGTLAETANADDMKRNLGYISDATPGKGGGGINTTTVDFRQASRHHIGE